MNGNRSIRTELRRYFNFEQRRTCVISCLRIVWFKNGLTEMLHRLRSGSSESLRKLNDCNDDDSNNDSQYSVRRHS